MNYYQHHIGDYDSHTSHLTWLEDTAYRRLICLYYRTQKPLSLDVGAVCRLIRANSRYEKEAVQQVLSEFFTLEDDGYHSSRCDNEINAYSEKAEKNKANGAKGGRPKKEPNNNPPETDWVSLGFENETQTKGNQEPVTINQEPEPRTINQVKEHCEQVAQTTKEPKFDFKKFFVEGGADRQNLEDWLKVRKSKKAVNSQTALNKIIEQINVSGLSVAEVVKRCAEKSWSGYSAAWAYEDSNFQKQPSIQNHHDFSSYLQDRDIRDVTPTFGAIEHDR